MSPELSVNFSLQNTNSDLEVVLAGMNMYELLLIVI